ncbi:MAG: DUF234 domain-containing protein [Caldilineaceae bacterium]
MLRTLRWVEHRTPLGSARQTGQRWGTWHLIDAYIRFWARYVLPHVRRLEYDEADALLYELIRPTWAQFVGVVWEDIARQHLPMLSVAQEIPFWPEEIGSWWSAKVQIDLVGVNYAERLALLGEARWREEKVGMRYFGELENKAASWLGEQSGWKLFYALYSKRGFTDDLIELAAQRGNVLLSNAYCNIMLCTYAINHSFPHFIFTHRDPAGFRRTMAGRAVANHRIGAAAGGLAPDARRRCVYAHPSP